MAMLTKRQLIKKIEILPFGDILYGYTKERKLICINEYFEEDDLFNAYGKDGKPYGIKFEDIPQPLFRF